MYPLDVSELKLGTNGIQQSRLWFEKEVLRAHKTKTDTIFFADTIMCQVSNLKSEGHQRNWDAHYLTCRIWGCLLTHDDKAHLNNRRDWHTGSVPSHLKNTGLGFVRFSGQTSTLIILKGETQGRFGRDNSQGGRALCVVRRCFVPQWRAVRIVVKT